MKKCFGVSIKRIRLEIGGLVIVLVKRVSVSNHEKDVLLRRSVEARAIKVCDDSCLSCWRVDAWRFKKREQGLVVDHHVANYSVVYLDPCRFDSKKVEDIIAATMSIMLTSTRCMT